MQAAGVYTTPARPSTFASGARGRPRKGRKASNDWEDYAQPVAKGITTSMTIR
ncbi:hypothetical protein K270103H11_15770 [Gordonibacter urolithinfaciens]